MLNPRVSLEGAYDLHIHTAPSIYPRYLDDVEAALQARAAGMKGVMFKCHYESTVSRAFHTAHAVPGINVYGGIVLNNFVGGINPRIVEAVLEQGARQIWMPTMDSEEHRRVFGSVGSYGLKSMDAKGIERELAGISVLDKRGELIDVVKKVIDLVKDFDAILGTCHLSYDELLAVVRYAREVGAKVLVTHPFFTVPNLSKEALKQLTDLGGVAELTAVTAFNLPSSHRVSLQVVKEAIDYIGPNKFIISSDAGQPFNPVPVEAIRVYVESLYELGVPKTDLRTMMVETPEWLLSV